MKHKMIQVEIVKVISEHKRRYTKENRPEKGFKRVQAIIKWGRDTETRHVDTKDGVVGYRRVRA